MADLSIQNAFLDGIEEIFNIMFTDRIQFQYMDEENTYTNVYEESVEKKYLDPIPLIGRVQTQYMQGEPPQESIQVDATITIPTKQLITNEIPHKSREDLEKLGKGIMSYDGHTYIIDRVVPKTLVADMWQMYDFFCHVDKKSSLTGGLGQDHVYE